MLKLFKLNWFCILFATLLILFSFTVFSNWVGIACIWFVLFFTFRLNHMEAKLSEQEHKIYLATVWLYPIVETWINWMIIKKVIPYSWFWLNRLEHFCASIAVAIIFLPTYKDIFQKMKFWQSLIYVIGLICIIGNLNEFFEYGLRWRGRLVDDRQFAAYYWDTIYDMMINIMGGLVGFAVLKWNSK